MSTDERLQGYFVTGSDTGVGKTWVTRQLIGQLLESGHRVRVRKPVESGCHQLDDGSLFPADGDELNQASGNREDLSVVTPYRLRAALAPDRAAQMEHKTITLENLLQSVRTGLTPGDQVVVEGAGGFYSPIADDGANADLAKALALPLIIVVDDRLGAINQALLTIKAAHSEGLTIRAVILNQVCENDHAGLDNLADLRSRTEHPVHHCPYQGVLPAIE